ncbi:hypothetical protein H6504_05310 [Candidatus Woesearchaeota archaeon]|nr:hypothetical protein [Candidatus Woesearchaeota archaeon]
MSEKRDLLVAWTLVSLCFVILYGRKPFMAGDFSTFWMLFFICGVTVGAGFLLHELAHRKVARHFGAFAEFKADMKMLLGAIGLSFLGFTFIAPGAVMISGNISNRQNGIIAAAGPVANLILCVIFRMIFNISDGVLMQTIGYYGFVINAWLAVFNMIPFHPFDGKKVWDWDKKVYAGVVALGVIFLFITYS